MPSINIIESDQTLVTAAGQDNVIFVPGFISPLTTITTADLPDPGVIKVFNSIDEFTAVFGQEIPVFAAGTFNYSSNITINILANQQDIGYLTARELLKRGCKVAYVYANSYAVEKSLFKGWVASLPESATQGDVYGLIAYDSVNGLAPGIFTYDVVNEVPETLGWKSYTNTEGESSIFKYPTYDDMYTLLQTVYDDFADKIEGIDVRYITSGGYPTFEYTYNAEMEDPSEGQALGTITLELVPKLLDAAASVNAVALIDHTNNPDRPLIGDGSVFAAVESTNYENAQFGAMFTPWSIDSTLGIEVPASYHYLLRAIDAMNAENTWLAVAGVTRGRVYATKLQTGSSILTNKIANSYTADNNTVSINAITNIAPYGLTIWGNRTLANYGGNLKATSFLNIRNIVNDIKKVAYKAATALMFEQNNEILWVNFKAKIYPTLEALTTGYGIQKYTLTKEVSTDRKKLKAKITLYPVYAVEAFDITIELRDEDTINGGSV